MQIVKNTTILFDPRYVQVYNIVYIILDILC